MGWGIHLIVASCSGGLGGRYGRYYFTWQNERRGFFELRRQPTAIARSSSLESNNHSLEIGPNEGLEQSPWSFQYIQKPDATFPDYRSWFFVILDAMTSVAEGIVLNEDSWSGGTLALGGGRITFWHPVAAPSQIRFQNIVWLATLGTLLDLPLTLDPPVYAATRLNILHTATPGPVRFVIIQPVP